MKTQWVMGLGLAFAAVLPAAADKAHTHGQGTLDVAIEGARVTLAFEAPLEDLVGFEREPANEKERAALQSLDAHLKSGNAFVPAAAAACKSAGSTVTIATPAKGHAEARATWMFDCGDMAALKSIEAGIFTTYSRLKRIDVRVAAPKGQSTRRLTPTSRVLKL